MKITDVKLISLKCKLPEPIKFSLGTLTYRNFALVKIETDEGIDGWGETFVNFPSWAPYERKATIEYGIKPLLVGNSPLEPEKLTNEMLSRLHKLGLQWGAKGCIYQAVSGANIALWDIKGKVEGKPVYKLLGGEKKEIPLYATGINMADLESSVSNCIEAGYKALKIRVGFDPEKDIASLIRVRKIVGEAVKIYVDVNQSWDKTTAEDMSIRMQEAGASWIEEPTLCEDLQTMARIAGKLSIPLAAGENYFGVTDFQKALEAKAFNVGMPDITRVGGFNEMKKVCTLLTNSGIPYSPHHYGTDIGFVASLHFMSAVPGYLELLRDVSNVSLREEVLKNHVPIIGGYAWPPDGPGLGIEVNEEVIQKFRF